MSYIITIISVLVTGLIGYIAKLTNDKTKLETSNRELKSDAITGPLEEKSHATQQEAIEAVRNYESMLAEFERISGNKGKGAPASMDDSKPSE